MYVHTSSITLSWERTAVGNKKIECRNYHLQVNNNLERDCINIRRDKIGIKSMS